MPAPRASTVIAAADLGGRKPFDSIVLPHDGRHRRRITMRTEGDFVFLLDLAEATQLRHGDGLVLEDGRIIGVEAAEEPVAEITATDGLHLARLAWHIGNRHVPAEIGANRILIAPDHTIEDMARGLGGTVRRIEARFDPEGGAYSHGGSHGHGAQLAQGSAQAHAHAQAHSHGQAHAHSHSHAHAHAHDQCHHHDHDHHDHGPHGHDHHHGDSGGR